jgi:hypothetical protein
MTDLHPIQAISNGVREWLNQPTPRKQMLPAYLILTVGIVLGFTRFENLAEQRANDVQAFAEQNAYAICVTRVETRDSLRSVLIGLTQLFDDSDAVDEIRLLIETDYAQLDIIEECSIPGHG